MKVVNDPLGSLVKGWESVHRQTLAQKVPTFIRLDGRAFHTLTKRMRKPHDPGMQRAMEVAALAVCEQAQNAVLAYSQSDEITVLMVDYASENSQQWFGGKTDKILSLSAGIASVHFNMELSKHYPGSIGYFDARVFQCPQEEVLTPLVWRQADAVRNSISALAQAHFSAKALDKVGTRERFCMLKEKGLDWSAQPADVRHGFCVFKESYTVRIGDLPDMQKAIEHGMDPDSVAVRSRWKIDRGAPLFVEDTSYVIEKLGLEEAPRISGGTMEMYGAVSSLLRSYTS